jgi:hypothetical protein
MDGRIEELRALIERHALPDMSTPIPGIMIARQDVSEHEQTKAPNGLRSGIRSMSTVPGSIWWLR